MQDYISIKEKKLAFSILGEGEIVVLLHGFGEDSTVWKNQVESLNGFRVLIPDLPGSGNSELIGDMSMEGMAKAIHEWLQHLGVMQCKMIGHSMGGYITLAFAEKYPSMLNGFGLFHSSAYADSEEKKQARKKGIEFISKNGAFEFLKTAIPNLYSQETKTESPGLIESQLAASTGFKDEALIAYYEAMMKRPDRTAVLKETRVPVLFVLGKHDTAVPFKDGLEQCHLPDLAHVTVLEKSGHMGMIEEAEKSNKALIEFINADK